MVVSWLSHISLPSIDGFRRLLAQGRSLRHRSDSVRFLRSFCRADEATGMPLHDPDRTRSDRAAYHIPSTQNLGLVIWGNWNGHLFRGDGPVSGLKKVPLLQ